MKGQKGTGKMGYSPESILEFYDDYLIETMPGKKIEQNYSEIENVCLVDMKILFTLALLLTFVWTISAEVLKMKATSAVDEIISLPVKSKLLLIKMHQRIYVKVF